GGLKAGATCAGSNSHRCSPNYQTSTPYESREIQPDVRSKPHSNVWDRLLGVQDERSRGTGMRLVVLAVLILTATTSPQINVTPNVFTTAFVGREQLHQSPLVVLRADTPVGGGASLPSELEIFSEDPNWNSKVEEFMVVTGANAHGIKNALKEVRHLAWAAGRTFQGRHVALLAFADDAYSDGDTTASCRLTRAVVAASRHVMDAHFILVADGFELDAAMRENVVRFRSDGHGSSRQRCHEGPRTNDEIMIDQWNRLPAAKLEALVQADADYFFLPLLLLQQSPGEKTHDEPRACLSFHSEWMERGPHKDLMHGALARRQEFPVAAVVVVHDDVSLLRPALEAAAIVVEYILVVVSRTPWNGDAMDITPTVELLESMMQDVASTTYGKLRVDVGSWATERDQRNYGNAVISEDPSRGFFRVVVMDANEFWHPVELAKALVTITRYPDAMIAQAEIDTYWASLRLAAFPSEMLNAVWLVDPRRCFWMMIDGYRLTHVYRTRRFVKAVANGDSAAGRYLSSYYADVEVPKRASDGYENVPTLVGMADMFINKLGHVWNEKARKEPRKVLELADDTCVSDQSEELREGLYFVVEACLGNVVFIMTQFWGDQYFHFLVDALPRITLMLDVLRENLDIKMAIYAPGPNSELGMEYMCEFLELLGLGRNRVIFLDEEIHAALAILPSSTPCGKTDTQTINMLRQALLQALYPSRGRPPLPPRPLIVLVVRTSKRGLQNSNQVRDALKQEFPAYDVVEFLGTGPIVRQLHLFATASLIVAPHGAGLSNMIVSPLHTPVLEIGSLDCPTCFMELALKLHHVYARHPGSSTWTTPCGTQYEPHIGEILLLVRDLLEANRQADAADPPRRGGGVQHL
ncbi:unnamed protein product, partial [Pylaiella littoralis]